MQRKRRPALTARALVRRWGSQRAVAAKLGCTQQAVSVWHRQGGRIPHPYRLTAGLLILEEERT